MVVKPLKNFFFSAYMSTNLSYRQNAMIPMNSLITDMHRSIHQIPYNLPRRIQCRHVEILGVLEMDQFDSRRVQRVKKNVFSIKFKISFKQSVLLYVLKTKFYPFPYNIYFSQLLVVVLVDCGQSLICEVYVEGFKLFQSDV